ncbi:MAG: alcohol dehydrogenase catalytic domain-containing protein [bacterium]
MKAAVVEKPGKLVIKDVPRTEIGEYGVLCKLLYGATCSGTDNHIINGSIPFPVEYPTILGHESIGKVVEVGGKVRNFKPGDLVTRVGVPPLSEPDYASNWGGFAEYGLARDHWAMSKAGISRQKWDSYRVNQLIPSGIEPAEATMIITWRETLSYLTRMDVGRGNSLLVIGSGANGLSFAAHAINRQARRVDMIGNINRKETAREIGITEYYDYKKESIYEIVKENFAEGYDYIIDAVGKKGLLNRALPLLKDNGTVGIYGIDDMNDNYFDPYHSQGTFTYYNNHYDEEETHHQVITYIKRGQLKPELWLDLANIYTLEDINKAMAAVRNRESIKAVVKLS